ncbi:ABC transporter ATP-binding protein [Streptococcus orisasini]|uniref:ABC transporter ATP-binding protein n=1 Tax=Streptococcus orisasini TaxID=1080071 RepID=UPI00070AD3E1|nr:ABC transporter ATP-binding protein [Streptococcus orisasini]
MLSQAISANNIVKKFQLSNHETVTVLNGISVTADYGEFVSILGVSGSGKSTLLKCLSSLMVPDNGTVSVNGLDPYALKDSQLAKFRRQNISMIFQSYNLVPELPVFENIILPLRLAHKKVSKEEVTNLLRKMYFEADINAFVHTLSGGEQQKVAIARTILAGSQLIFADEPTGALDSASRQVIFDLLKQLSRQGKCVVMVTHDIELASETDRSLILKDGQIFMELHHPNASDLYAALRTDKR